MSHSEFRALITRRPVFLWSVALALLVWGVAHLLRDQQIGRIEVKVEGEHVPAADVARRLEKFRGRNFWSLDLRKVAEQARGHAWVAGVKVARIWPSTLIVSVREHVVAARWGKDGLVSEKGVPFFPDNPATLKPFADYVLLKGQNPEQAAELLQAVRTLRGQARPLGWRPVRLQRLADGSLQVSWQPRGRRTLLDEKRYREQFHRLVAAWPKLYKSLRIQAKIFDLRYSNGFVLRTGR